MKYIIFKDLDAYKMAVIFTNTIFIPIFFSRKPITVINDHDLPWFNI